MPSDVLLRLLLLLAVSGYIPDSCALDVPSVRPVSVLLRGEKVGV